MPDLTRHVAAGDPLAIGAGTWNQVLDAARAYGHQKQGRNGGRVLPAAFPATLVVQVKNDTGDGLDRGAVLTPTGVEVSPVDDDVLDVQRQPVFTADEPTAGSDPVLILIEPVAAGDFGAAAIGGTAVATVNVSDVEHEYARPTAAHTDRLESATTGPARILWRAPGGTGDRVCVVVLNNGGPAGGAGGGGEGNLPKLVVLPSGDDATGPPSTDAEFQVVPGEGTTGAESFWSLPAQPARSGVPGWMDAGPTVQEISGPKTWEDDAAFLTRITVAGGWSGGFAGGDDFLADVPAADVGGIITGEAVVIPGVIVGAPFIVGGSLFGSGIRFFDASGPASTAGESVIDSGTAYSGVFASDDARDLTLKAADILNIQVTAQEDGDTSLRGLQIDGDWTRQTNTIRLPGYLYPGSSGSAGNPVYEFKSGILKKGEDDANPGPTRAGLTCWTNTAGNPVAWTTLIVPEGDEEVVALRITGGDEGGFAWASLGDHFAELLVGYGEGFPGFAEGTYNVTFSVDEDGNVTPGAGAAGDVDGGTF